MFEEILPHCLCTDKVNIIFYAIALSLEQLNNMMFASNRYLIYVNVSMKRWELEAVTFLDLMMVMWLVLVTAVTFIFYTS